MSLNPFYALLCEVIETVTLSGCSSIERATTLEQKKYIRACFARHSAPIEQWRLFESHLSFYENIHPLNPKLGACHYTAIWVHDNGQAYRMHLYLDDQDNLACIPGWEKIDDEGYVPVKEPVAIESLLQAAWAQIIPAMQNIRELQRNTVQRLQSHYKEIEMEMSKLSINFAANHERYLELCTENQMIVRKLYDLTGEARWQRVGNYFKHLQKSMIDMAPLPEVSDSPSPKFLNSVAPVEPKEKKVKPSQTNDALRKLVKKPSVSPFIQKIQSSIDQLVSRCNAMMKSNDTEEKLQCLLMMHQQLADLQCHRLNQVSVKYLERLHQTEARMETQAQSLLQGALMAGDFAMASRMNSFYTLVNPDIINLALMRRDAKLLECILIKLRIPLHTYPIKVGGVSYRNAVDYCVQTHSSTNDLSACFSVLIAMGANLMEPSQEQGLPIAYRIMSQTPPHGLYSVFKEHSERTLNNISFYRQLIGALSDYCRQGDISECLKKELVEAMDSYRSLVQTLKLTNSFFTPKTIQAQEEMQEAFDRMFKPDLVKMLEEDPELRQLRQQLEDQSMLIISKYKELSKKSPKRLMPINRAIQEGSSKITNMIQELDLKIDTDFKSIKQEAVSYCTFMQEYSYNVLDLMDTQLSLLKFAGRPGRASREHKKLANHERELIAIIKRQECNLPDKRIANIKNLQEQFDDFKISNDFFDVLTNLANNKQDEMEMLMKLMTLLPEAIDEEEEEEEEQQFTL